MKKSIAFLLVLCLVFTLIPAAAFAKGQTNSVTLEKAIEIAKSYFEVPKDYDQFDSSYEQTDFTNVWSLRWSPKNQNDGNYGELSIRIDAQSGEVAGYSYYNSKDYQGNFSNLPKVSKKDGEQIALDFIKKVAPSKVGQIVLKPNNQVYYGGGPIFHYYNFNRVINGIEYPANNINIEISGETGEVRSFYVNWENLSSAPKGAKLTPEDAQKIFEEKFGFELRYFKPYPENRVPKPIKLVYEVVNPYQVNIDASTGEIVPDQMYYPYFKETYDMGSMGGATRASNQEALEPYEQEVVDELKGLITRDEALAIAKKAIDLPSTFKMLGSQLYSDYEFPELKIWSFNWNVEEKNHYGWANVEVDAKTGKVLAFNFNEDYYNPEQKEPEKKPLIIKSREEAEKKVQAYLKENFPGVVDNLRVPKDARDVIPLVNPEPDKDLPSYYFRYERLVDGVPFSNNYVNASVNSYTGKISDFRIRFLDQEFPKKDNVLDQAKFTADFFAKDPMNLVYTRDNDRNLRLVYKLPAVDSFRFDAVTGVKLGWNGEPIKEVKSTEITDITGHWAEKDIATLNELGLLRVTNGQFAPDSEITQAEVIKLLVKVTNGYLNDAEGDKWYEPYYKRAKEMGLIFEQEVSPTAAITRENMAKFLVRGLVWDSIATLDIYKLDAYQDLDKISTGYLGYVAIASELGLLTGDGANWNPQANVKKGEACVVTVRYLKLEKNNR